MASGAPGGGCVGASGTVAEILAGQWAARVDIDCDVLAGGVDVGHERPHADVENGLNDDAQEQEAGGQPNPVDGDDIRVIADKAAKSMQ